VTKAAVTGLKNTAGCNTVITISIYYLMKREKQEVCSSKCAAHFILNQNRYQKFDQDHTQINVTPKQVSKLWLKSSKNCKFILLLTTQLDHTQINIK